VTPQREKSKQDEYCVFSLYGLYYFLVSVRGESMAIYTCGKCLYCFEKRKDDSSCPDCGHSIIRVATKSEVAEYWKNKKEFSTDEIIEVNC